MPRTQIVSLPIAFTHDDIHYETMMLREPTVGDILDLPDGENRMVEVALLASCCGITPDVLRAMPLANYASLQQALLSFHSSPDGMAVD